MNWKKCTKIFIISVAAVIIVYDLITFQGDKHSTISEIIKIWSWSLPLLPLAWGVLAGHFFFPSKLCRLGPWRYFLLAGITILTTVIGRLAILDGWSMAKAFDAQWMLVFGVILGAFLWAQEPKNKDVKND